ncbi:RNA-directed DNA polymerase, eukaryota, reverse transcriptase zinc-binding domain protein, partial [Tanacetum coccineum]
MSGVGKPMLMDKLTRERCLKKVGKLDFARVLVEDSASDELPNVLEIEYPAIRDRPGRIGKLIVKYQWKPPQCLHCKTFGHSTSACKVRPRIEDEVAAKVLKEALKNKPMSVQSGLKYNGNLNKNNYSFQNMGYQTSSRLNGNFGRPNVARRGPNQQDRNVRGGFKSQSNGVKDMGIGKASGKEKGNGVMSSMANVVPALKKSVKSHDDRECIVHKPPLNSKYSANFQPKVLVRGSGSNKQMGDKDEDIHVKNSFQVLEDHEMKDKEDCFLNSVHDEYKNVVWPKLKCEVEDVMKSGLYPSKSIRSNWSLSQLDFFYNNCSKYGIEPYLEDDDVESDDEGMAVEMKSGMDSGLNNDLSQNQAIDMIRNGGFSICALLETKLKKKKLSRICSKVLGRWDWISNASSCEGGTGIVVWWDSNAVRVILHSQTSQIMNVFVEAINGNQKKFCSFVYGHYKEYVRKSLWKDLSLHFLVVKNAPWVLLGDFNVILEPSERSFGYSGLTFGMEEFRSCVSKIEVCDLVMSGLQFTWNKSPLSPNVLLKKLDRVMCNMGFFDKFPNANAIFLPFVCSDHAPSVLSIPNVVGPKPKPFKFANFLSQKAEFLPLVKSVWNVEVPSHAMFSLAFKLKMLKKPLRKLKEPFNAEIRVEEVVALKAYIFAVKDEELFLKQRSKITWLSKGDFNTKFFHNSMMERRNKGRVEEMVAPIHEPATLFVNKLSLVDAELMVKPISLEEIKDVLFSMNDDKAPGPDGYSARFFKAVWSVVGSEFSQAILDFFINVIKSAFDGFSRISGLKSSMEKSMVFFGNVSDHVKAAILGIMPFSVGCNLLSLLSVGIKSLHLWNVALMSKNIWNIVSKEDSLWVKWVNSYRLIDRRSNVRNFWNILLLNDVCWGWRKILLYRDVIREHIVTRIGNGKDTSVWFDNWSFLGPLCKFISNRDIFEAELSLSCKVADVVCNEEWNWPCFLKTKFEFLFFLPHLLIFHDRLDKVLWKSKNNKVFPFSVSRAWSDLSIPMPIVPWFKIVWFSPNIPRFAFIPWLSINKKLNTQDKVAIWNKVDKLKCLLCNAIMDNYDYLFFGCEFSLKVWKFFKDMMRCGDAPDNLFLLLTILYLDLLRHSRSVDDICSIIKDSV